MAGKAVLDLSGCLPTENADNCVLSNEWTWLRSPVCLLRLEVHLGSVLESELRQMWHIKGMYKLKVVSSKKCKLKRPKVILHAPRTNTIHISMTSCQNPATNIWH